MRRFLALCLALAAAHAAPAAEFRAVRVYSPADVVELAARHASALEAANPGGARYARYVSLHAWPTPEARARAIKGVSLALNSLSTEDAVALPQVVGPDNVLVYVNLQNYGISPKAVDRLGLLGSGPAPFPEPFFHLTQVEDVKATPAVTETYEETYEEDELYLGQPVVEWVGGQWVHKKVTRTRTRTRVSRDAVSAKSGFVTHLGKWAGQAATIGLVTLTHSEFPVFEGHWFVSNALVEPRYHELLGLDDREESVLKLADADERFAERIGSLSRGAVLFSEVGDRNRALQRVPTRRKFGRGAFYRSLDFKASVGPKNVMGDLLLSKADAFEILYTLPNGMQGAWISDARRRRLDKADPDVAQDNRTRFRDHQVWTAYKCLACHLADDGWIPIEDEVALGFGRKQVSLYADQVSRTDAARGRKIRQQYLSVEFNELVQQDGAFTRQAIAASTGGLTGQEAGELLQEIIWEYVERPVTADVLSLYTGATAPRILRTIRETPGLDNSFAGIRIGRKQRPDQVEAALGQLLTVLYARGN